MKKQLLSILFIFFIFLTLSSGVYSSQDIIDPYKSFNSTEPFMPDQPLSINVRNVLDTAPIPDKYTGWLPAIQGRLYGPVKDGDSLKIELLKDGKVVRGYRVPLNPVTVTEYEYFQDWQLPNYEDKDPVSSTGEFGLVFKYTDFATEKDRILGEKKINIIKAGAVDCYEGKHIWKYAIVCGELPAISYMFLRSEPNNSFRGVFFYTWICRESDFIEDIKYKISVNGAPLELPSGTITCNKKLSVEQEESMYDYKKMAIINNRYRFHLIEFGSRLCWGQKEETGVNDYLFMIDYPGDWSVKIYSAGKMIREFKFKVTPDGTIAIHPEQDPLKTEALILGPMRFFIETYYPNPNDFDERFYPEEMMKGSFFGRPWISNEIQGMLKALPPKKSGVMTFPSTQLPADK